MASSSSSSSLNAARGTLLSIALRLLSFLLSQLTVRYVSNVGAYGKASISLELLLSTALFVGREGFRLAVTKEVVDGHDDDGDDDADDNSNYQINSTKSTSNNNGDDDTEMMTTQQKQQRRLVKKQQIVNVSWLSIPVGTVLSILALLVHLRQCNNTAKNNGFGTTSTPTTKDVNQELWDYKLAGILYCLSSFIEALSEPLVIQCLQRMDITTKAKAEGVALVAKSLCCFTCTVYLNEHNYAVTAFGISQLMYATLFTVLIYHSMIARTRSSSLATAYGKGGGGILWPKYIINTTTTTMRSNPYRIDNNVTTTNTKTSKYYSLLSNIIQNNFYNHTIYLIVIFTLQGIFKHALTEADKFILSGFSDSYDQGVYALVSSYGGLAARLLLQPMEENARLLFSRQGARIVAAAAAEEEEEEGYDDTSTTNKKNTKTKNTNLINDLEASYYFFVRLVMYIGLIFAAFGSNYTAILLRLLAGNRWGTNIEACTALSAFCVYTAFLALNGITEAFVYGVARSGKDVTSMGIVHAIVGIVFALFAPTLVTRYGALGLIVANCISMVMRCLYSLLYIRSYFATHSASGQTSTKRSSIMSILSRMFPHIVVMMAFAASFLICRFSSIHTYNSQIAAGTNWMMAGAQHIGVGLLCIVVTLGLSSWFETDMKEAILNVMKRKRE